MKHLRSKDLVGIARLATQATQGVARISEGVHQAVWSTMGVPGGKNAAQTRGITGLVYRTIHGITQLVGKGLDSALVKLQPVLEDALDHAPETPEREAVVAALNGVMGDHLAATHNPLATPMTLRHQGKVLDWAALPADFQPTGKALVLIHGLCMNDLQWHAQHQGTVVDHGQTLATERGYTPLHLRYNTGLHTSQNGHSLAAMLEQLVSHWPVPLQELTLVVHSMGGLISRSALHYAAQEGMQWPQQLKSLVFLGTPHHGAPLERAGNWIDVILGATPYSRPFAKLGQLRSAGITDLRYGLVLDDDWVGQDRFRRKPDSRKVVALPSGPAFYTVAATLAAKRSVVAERLLGDGLVPLNSALGRHDAAEKTLVFAPTAQCIFYRMNHMELMSRPEVTQQLLLWLE